MQQSLFGRVEKQSANALNVILRLLPSQMSQLEILADSWRELKISTYLLIAGADIRTSKAANEKLSSLS